MKKTIIILLVLIAGGYFGWQWYAKRQTVAPLDFKTVAVSRGDITQTVTANGQLSPVKNVTVGSQVSGIITAIYVDFNSRVTNGQMLAQIDPSTYKQIITQAEADLANVVAAQELAQINHRRALGMLTNNIIAVSEYDKAVADMHQAEAVVKMREAVLSKAKVDLERTTIFAPIDGVVITRAVDVGQTVAASFSTPTMFAIANDLKQMRIEAMVSEADVGGIEEGQNVTFSVDAFPSRPFLGKVTQVRFAPITNQNVVNYTSVVEVNNDDLKLRPGMTANAAIVTAKRADVLRVPNAALRIRPPEGAVVIGLTNSATSTVNGTNKTVVVVASNSGDLPSPPWVAEGRTPSSEERQKWRESLTPEQREKMRERRAQSGEGRGAGRSSSASVDGPAKRTVYLLEKAPDTGDPILRAVTIKTGISDGSFSEVLEGLKEDDAVVVGINATTKTSAAKTTTGTSPFGGPFGGMRPPR